MFLDKDKIKEHFDEIKENLTVEQIYDFLENFGGEPEYTSFGIISSTICHNLPKEGSRKLYYYDNTKLFRCYTGCDSTFDIFELFIKIKDIQENVEISTWQAMNAVANFFGIKSFNFNEDEDKNLEKLNDWDIIKKYKKAKETTSYVSKSNLFILKEYNKEILNKFLYPKISIWEKEGIDKKVIKDSKIGYYPVGEQITIPHFDISNRLVGLRGRSLIDEEALLYGKYRPLTVSGRTYKHPLGLNLYNLNNSKEDIAVLHKAIIFEGEKSCLLFRSFFDTDVSVACCGSNISKFQITQLVQTGAQEIIIAFDRQFQEISDKEFLHLKRNLLSINRKYSQYVNISFIFDSKKITSYKASPIDEGKEKFLQLFQERIIL